MKKWCFYRINTAFLLLFLWGCSFAEQETKREQLVIASWNVQNLFDGADNGFEYDEFKNSAGWNNEKYQARLHGITAALKGESGIRADILALIEVENKEVIQDLAEKSFLNYRWTFFAGAPAYSAMTGQPQAAGQSSLSDSSIGLGILSALPLTETRVHSLHSQDGSIPRPVAEVWVDTGSGPLALLACHWKSKLGGEAKTEAMRRAAAALIVRRLLEIEAESPGTPVIILGDLNENCDEFERINGAYPCALLPDTKKAAALAGKTSNGSRQALQDFLVVSRQKPPRTDSFTGTTAVVFSPWLTMEEDSHENRNESSSQVINQAVPQGSYYYKDDWETIDHFLLNAALFSGQGWNYERFRVLAEPPFTNAEGITQAYNPRTGNGLSDHLPIVLILHKP